MNEEKIMFEEPIAYNHPEGNAGSLLTLYADVPDVEPAEKEEQEDTAIPERESNVPADAAENENRAAASSEEEEGIDLDEFQIAGGQFFAQINEPAFTINVRKISVNAAAVRMLPDVEYMEILIKPDAKKIVLCPCDEMSTSGYKWAKEKDGRRYATERTGEPFVLNVCKVMGWNPDYRYKIRGKKDRSKKGEEILVFDLMVAQEFPKDGEGKNRMSLLESFNGTFGPKYGEARRSLHVDTFEGFTVFSVHERRKKGMMDKPGLPEGTAPEGADEE